ncbi:hypothetical protein TrLO_g978 [Triparma laevis f. longispina]|nr:hypothetical protein TrLO_g978 [Triparma laevis f. longispina]
MLLNDDNSNEHSLNYYNSNNRNDDRLNKPIRTGTFYTNLLIFQSDLQSTSYPIISDYYKTTFTSSSISIENSLQHPPKIETEPFYSQTSQFSNPFTLKCPNRGEFNTKDHTSLSVTVSIKSEECEIETSIVLGSVFYTVKLKGDYIIEGGEFKSLGEGFFKADSFIVYSTSGELSGGDTILRIFPNLEETTTDYLIDLGIKSSYPTTGRIYGNYAQTSSIIIEHDYLPLTPTTPTTTTLTCLTKTGGTPLPSPPGLKGPWLFSNVKLTTSSRGLCEIRKYPNTINYNPDIYKTGSTCLIDASLEKQIGQKIDPKIGVYSLGKILLRLSLECVISHNSGSKMCENEVIPYIDGVLRDLFLSKKSYFMYDTTLGGITTRSGSNDHNADFGNGIYNDHHYHYGYLLHSISLIDYVESGKGSGRISQKYGRFFDGLANDVCNYQGSEWYVIGRYMDMYEGHSWASGVERYAEGKGQESVSEAVNCYVGCWLWGGVRGDEDMERFGRVMAEIEVAGAKQLWQRPSGNMLGIVSSTALTGKTWFGDKPQYRHGINIMPITAITPYLVSSSWAAKEWEVLKHDFDGFEDEWKSILAPIVALHDPEKARDIAGEIKNTDAGTSLGLVSWFIESMGGEPLPEPEPVPEPDADAKCEKFEKCEKSGLTGYCCPTLQGLELECCN